MLTKKLVMAGVAAAIAAGTIGVAQAEEGQFIPALTYRTGPFAPGGIPTANGYVDYFHLINERDGGVNGVKFIVEECEYGYKTDPRRRMLRPAEGQAWRRDRRQPVFHRHDLCADRQGHRRQDSDPVDGLRPHQRC